MLLSSCGSKTAEIVSKSATSVGSVSTGDSLPAIISASSVGITQGTIFSYQIEATNNPTSYGASGLPDGLSINASTGLITGTVLNSSPASAELSASNLIGKSEMVLQFTPVNSATLVGSTNNCASTASIPAPASTVGFSDLTFCDDFDSESTIDAGGTGNEGYHWYTNLPYGMGQTLPSAYFVANSVLTLTSTGFSYNWGLSTRDPKTGKGSAWTFGYFEARVTFDPALGPNSQGWPSFWAISARQAQETTNDRWAELDFFEAVTSGGTGETGWASYGGIFAGSLHDWQGAGGKILYTNANAAQYPQADWTQWHIIGCLWVPGQVTWYLDGDPLMTQQYSGSAPPDPLAGTAGGFTPSPAGVFNILDAESMGMELIVGSSPGWPINIDWVRVWQAKQ
jgi:hypothetical protein